MKYKSVTITRKGSPVVLQIVENDLREPVPGETRLRVLATGVGRTVNLSPPPPHSYGPSFVLDVGWFGSGLG